MGFSTLLFLFSTVAHAHDLEGAVGIQDRVNRFVNSDHAYRSLLDYQNTVGTSGWVAFQPWSSTYWPLDKGMAANAYADRGGHTRYFGINKMNFDSSVSRLQRRIENKSITDEEIDFMSPTEKYDLYLGDDTFTLSKAIWQSLAEAEKNSKHHSIQDWEGICHGWAPASSFMKRPTKKFTVASIDGRFNIPFYPDDLKALGSLLWANSLIQDNSMVEGIRCDTNNPAIDYGSGKVLRTRCKGVNPGVWHLSVLGLIGEKHRPFIINKNNDIEIWNQPVTGFDFKYYNPKTNETGKVEQVAVRANAYNDDFKSFRDPKTVYIVGVDMLFHYMDETEPSHAETDDKKNDSVKDMHMKYELELDEAYNVLGGEWSSENDQDRRWIPNYPGFMWRFQSDYPVAASIMDIKVPELTDPAYHDGSLMRGLSAGASAFRYQKYRIDDTGDTDKLELDKDGKIIPEGLELRPQPLGKVVYELMDKAAQ